MKSLDEVKSQIEPIMKHQKGQQAAEKKAEALLKQAEAEGLDAAAAEQDARGDQLDFFGRKDMLPGLGPAPQFMDAVFSRAGKIAARCGSGVAGNRRVSVAGESSRAATPTFEEIRSRVEDGIQERALLDPAVAEDAGAFRPRQSRTRSEASGQGTGRHHQDQRFCAARWTGSGRRFDVRPGLGGLHHEAGRDQRSHQQRADGVVLQCSKTSNPPTPILPPSAIRSAISCCSESSRSVSDFSLPAWSTR